MSRFVLPLLLGLVLGSAGGWLAAREYGGVPSSVVTYRPAPEASPSPQCAPACEPELSELRMRLAALEATPTTTSAVVDRQEPVAEEPPSASSQPQAKPTPSGEALRWRISAIEKFVPLDDEQRRRLTVKFQADAAGESKGETLEDILGEENARFYRDQVAAAFKRVEEEEVDREVVWLSRQLSLTREQEQKVRDVFSAIEREISEGGGESHSAQGTPQDRVRSMIEENKRRAQLRSERLRGVLSDDQYAAFARVEAESSSADMEVFHDPAS